MPAPEKKRVRYRKVTLTHPRTGIKVTCNVKDVTDGKYTVTVPTETGRRQLDDGVRMAWNALSPKDRRRGNART